MPPWCSQNSSKKISFADDLSQTEKTSSQRSSYKDVLSQPPVESSHIQKLLWLQKRRTAGLWAQCDDCDRWRYLSNVLDRHELPQKWYCRMNTDKDFASCTVPEAPLRLHDEEDLIHSEYSAGSLVWAHMPGWPWWPAMVDDCPDTEQYYWLDGFSDIPTHYNVVFFDTSDVTRAWIAPQQLQPYTTNKRNFKHLLKNKKYAGRLKAAMSQADEADNMTLVNRLEKYSFLSRHKGNISSPKKLSKNDLIKYKRQFKKKFNIDISLEDSDSDEERYNNIDRSTVKNKNNNMIILGTPKKAKRCNATAIEPPNKGDLEIGGTQQPHEIGSLINTEKPSNSMLVQVGSTEQESIDNDTSTTYAPDLSTQQFSVGLETPNSDDFDF